MKIHNVSEGKRIWRIKKLEYWDIYLEKAIVFDEKTPIEKIFTEENLYSCGLYDKDEMQIQGIEFDTYTVYVTYLEIGEKGDEDNWLEITHEWTEMNEVAIFEEYIFK